MREYQSDLCSLAWQLRLLHSSVVVAAYVKCRYMVGTITKIEGIGNLFKIIDVYTFKVYTFVVDLQQRNI